MIRVVAVDDHPALRAGLLTVLRSEPGIVPLAAVGTAEEAMAEVSRGPDVMLVDYELPDQDGVSLCRQLKELPDAPRVLMFSAHADEGLTVAARLAGAHGMLDKGASADRLFDAIRTIAAGGNIFPSESPQLLQASAELLDQEDLPVLGMLLEGTSQVEIAGVLRIDPAELSGRVDRMIERLKPAGGSSDGQR